MSYNVGNIDIVSSEGFFISRERLEKLRDELGDDVPESNVFYDYAEDGNEAPFWYPKRFSWCGEGSGHFFDCLIARVLPAFEGAADLVACFEDGDSYQGLRLRNHVVTQHAVVMTLGDEE